MFPWEPPRLQTVSPPLAPTHPSQARLPSTDFQCSCPVSAWVLMAGTVLCSLRNHLDCRSRDPLTPIAPSQAGLARLSFQTSGSTPAWTLWLGTALCFFRKCLNGRSWDCLCPYRSQPSKSCWPSGAWVGNVLQIAEYWEDWRQQGSWTSVGVGHASLHTGSEGSGYPICWLCCLPQGAPWPGTPIKGNAGTAPLTGEGCSKAQE